jgi:hypothetical protein
MIWIPSDIVCTSFKQRCHPLVVSKQPRFNLSNCNTEYQICIFGHLTKPAINQNAGTLRIIQIGDQKHRVPECHSIKV